MESIMAEQLREPYTSTPTFYKISRDPVNLGLSFLFLPELQDSFQRQDFQKHHILNFKI